MSRQLGYFADDSEADNPSLNKCPDCECFYEGLVCPLCGKECPPEMRAGMRKPPKKKRSHGSSRASFLPWYHQWWFIILMLIFMLPVGIILLFTSSRSVKSKIIYCAAFAVYLLIFQFGAVHVIGNYIAEYRLTHPGISQSELRKTCEAVDPIAFCRTPAAFKDKYVKLELQVKSFVEDMDDNSSHNKYYVCNPIGKPKVTVLVRDCMDKGTLRLFDGDTVTVYGKGGGEATVTFSWGDNGSVTAVCVNMYAADVVK